MSDTEKAWLEWAPTSPRLHLPNSPTIWPRTAFTAGFEAGRLAALEEAEKAKAEWQAEALEQLANEDGDWTARAWRPQEAETVVKMRKAILRRAARLRSSSPEGSN